MSLPILIFPSILSADLARLQEAVDSIAPFADGIQADVMDGHFVKNLTFGAPVLKCLKTQLPLDVHLMVTNPADRVAEFLGVGASHITFHAEAVTGTAERKELIAAIRKGGLSRTGRALRLHSGQAERGLVGGATAGIALNPDTPVSAIEDVVGEVDLVLVMSVHPGFSNQAFIPEVLEKVKALRSRFPNLTIQMDGGIDAATARLSREAGANSLVSASFVFSAKDRQAAIASLRA